MKAVTAISKDAVQLTSTVANDPRRMCLLPYDNFNWAWKTSATDGTISHDQVSALLVVLDLPPGSRPEDAARLSHVLTFDQTRNTRHHLDPALSLEQILPSSGDQNMFQHNSIIHVANILAEEIASFAAYKDKYFLPTYDQEQSSTRGNMLVIEHYFIDVLKVPKEVFDKKNYFLLGDKLTTARDQAAQDQRAIARSEYRVDHLASFELLSGLIHVCLNQIQNMGKNTWGASGKDPVSLSTLLAKLPNTTALNLRKVDFYAWLRFFDVVLRSLVLRAAMVVLRCSTVQDFHKIQLSQDGYKSLCIQVVTQFLLPSIDRLESEGTKLLPASTESGNAVLLMHDLMTMREMRHAIKHGHPERVERMLKYWTPIFYAGGSYNYANELMELLHNLIHDWPSEAA
ncbi:hypothetical protein R3P38DRAFT_3318279 [Favolaschia claudopus]|uniref:DUF6589 domain-containing protein n=1 Tax=Favolaschia claudopus TaxID=2862362 RepID=A0AAW0B4N3_9AGAR